MGIQKLSEFKTDLIQASGNRALDATQMTRWVNSAMYEVGYAFQFPELQKVSNQLLVQNQPSYSMPADFRALTEDGVRIITPQSRFGGILTPESRTQYLRSDRYPLSVNQAAAGFYHMFGKKLWIRPLPDAVGTTVEFDYWARATPLAGPNDVTPFDEDWDEIIFRGAMYRMHLAYGEHDRMINVFNLFLAGIRSRVMAVDLQEFPEGGISMIQSAFDNNVR